MLNTPDMVDVTFILFPRFQMLAYVLATETLRMANNHAGCEVFRWQTLSATNLPVEASNGALVAPDATEWKSRDQAGLILLCAGYDPLAYLTARVRAYAARAARRACVIGGIDTGTVILAELGLLAGAKAVLHYEAEAAFRERWPDVDVTDQIYCLDGNRLTAAGGTATGDAMLAWIERDMSASLAQATANRMVHGEPRRSETPQRKMTSADPILLRMHQMMIENIAQPVSVKHMCTQLGITQKQLLRRCKATYGQTPIRYYQVRRLETARHLITNSQIAVSDIAQASGFESVSSFSRAIRNEFGSSPLEIRKRSIKPQL